MNVIKQPIALSTHHWRAACRISSTLALILASTQAKAQAGAAAPPPPAPAPAAAQPGPAAPPSAAGVQPSPTQSAPATGAQAAPSPPSAVSGTLPEQAEPTPAPGEVEAGETASASVVGESDAAGAAPSTASGPNEGDLEAMVAAAVEAELATREAEEEVKSQAPGLRAFGFADFTYARQLTHNERNLIIPRLPSFYVGNFNLYLDADLGSRWRSLSEVRFTYLPDGATMFTESGLERVSSSYGDYADYGRPRKVGGVIIERVWLEYSAHPLFNIRGGQWLTPYGIWNVDHGSPVVIGVTRPYIVGNELFPSHQTGLELYGSYGIDSTTIGYHVTLSNGRGPLDTYADLDRNKALGWRVWARQDTSFGVFNLGTSGYRGRYTDTTAEVVFSPDMTDMVIQYPATERYEELGLAADFKWTWGGYILQGEAVLHDVARDDYHRPAGTWGAPGWLPDTRTWGAYGITGYRLPWLGTMPFVGLQYMDFGKGDPFTVYEWSGGLNIRPTDSIVLKAVGMWVTRSYPGVFSKSEGQFMAQAAWSF